MITSDLAGMRVLGVIEIAHSSRDSYAVTSEPVTRFFDLDGTADDAGPLFFVYERKHELTFQICSETSQHLRWEDDLRTIAEYSSVDHVSSLVLIS